MSINCGFLFLLLFLTTDLCSVLSKVLECTEAIQGDILLSRYQRAVPGGRRVRRAVTAVKSEIWPNKTIPYVIAPGFSERAKLQIKKAMGTWQRHTCIRFVPRTNESDYTEIRRISGCCSSVGRQGGLQHLLLGYGCHTFPIILHELGHLLGFWHEQSRPDRDDYVVVLYDNIQEGQTHNFGKQFSTDPLGQPFDYRSIMLYGTNVFSRNARRTLKPRISTYNLKEQGFDYFYAHTRRGASALSRSDILQANLLYKCPYIYENGGILVGTTGNLTSPNYPKPYPKQRDFSWTILAAEFNTSQILTLIIERINVGTEDSDGECPGDYVEIRKGKGQLAPYLAKVCGSKRRRVLAVFHDSLYIKLHSTNSTKIKPNPHPTVAAHQPLYGWQRNTAREVDPVGFMMRYKVSGCKHVLTELNGTITSPYYPTIYSKDLDCIWQISAPEGYRIHITFEDFDFRPVDIDHGCLDYLEMREGNEEVSSKLLSLNCGRDFPKDLVTQTNHMRLFMHSDSQDGARRGQGFKAHYKAVDIDECQEKADICEHGCQNIPGGYACGCKSAYRSIFTDSNQVKCIDIDECQNDNGGCSHICTNTHGNHFCSCPTGYYLDKDKRTCIDSDECRLSICSQECSNTPGSFVCSCKYGYALDPDKKTCKLAIPMCTGVLSSLVGKFTSPPIPSWLQGSVDCEWTIRVRQRYTIGMSLSLSWSRDQNCRNYMKISINEGSGMRTLKLCGYQDVDGLLHFKAHELRVHYHTEAPYPEGFSLRYHMRPKKEDLCGGTLYGPKGTLQSPGYPLLYPSRSNCLWKIQVQRGRKMFLSFEAFDLENERECKYDYLDILVKYSSSSNMRPIGRFCGKMKPPLIGTREGELWVRFKSDGTVQTRGFRAKYYYD